MFASFQRTLWIGLLAATASVGPVLAEGVKGRPIEYSTPRQERDQSEPAALVPGQTRLDQWESELNNPFKSLLPGKSLDGMIMPTPLPLPPSSVPMPRSRDNNKRDWMFQTPEEMFAIQTLEDKYKAPELTADGRNRKDVRPMERAYMDALDATWSAMRTNGSGQVQSSDFIGGYRPGGFGGTPNPTPGNSLPGSMNQAEESIRRAFGMDPGTDGSRPTDATDFFKFNNQFTAPNKPTDSEIQRAAQYRQILDFNNPLSDSSVPNAPGVSSPFSSPYVDSSFFELPQRAAPMPAATLGGDLSGSTLSGAVLPAWSPPVASPDPAPITAAPTTSPFFTSPRRNF